MVASHGEGGRLGLDLREQATSFEKENDPLEVGEDDGKDVSKSGRRKELRKVLMKLGACEENVLAG